jgi:hypothetical protein
MKPSQQIINECNEAWTSFLQDLGQPDIYTKIVLQVLFEEIYAAKNNQIICVSGETGQTGITDTDGATGG